jgi:hypothetical protein
MLNGWDSRFVSNYPLLYDSGEIGGAHTIAKHAMGHPRHKTHYRGPPNPKTMLPPVVAPPIYGEAWRSALNQQRKSSRIGYDGDLTHFLEHMSAHNTDMVDNLPDIQPAPHTNNPDDRDGLVEAYRRRLNNAPIQYQEQQEIIHPPLVEQYHPSAPMPYNERMGDLQLGDAPYEQNYPVSYDESQPVRALDLPNSLQVDGTDNRFLANEYYPHRSTIQPTQSIYEQHVSYPINDNIGISMTPEYHEEKNELGYSDVEHYHHNMVNPQLIRNDVSYNRAGEMPTRDVWSAKHSPYEAPPSTIPIEDIYDPRLTGYGDTNRSYEDLVAGQVRYYYRNVDAYKQPNYILRSKTDHLDYHAPNGEVMPIYDRVPPSLDEARQIAEDDFLANSMYHREDMMARLSTKMNARDYQLRMAPLHKASNGNFSLTMGRK